MAVRQRPTTTLTGLIATPEAIGPGGTRVLAAVLLGARVYPEIIEATGMARRNVHHHLHRLRDAGLVAFEDGTQGTLRPLVHPVPFG